MSGALLVENELHHTYWRKKGGATTIIYQSGTAAAAGHGFENCIDENAGTTFKIANSTQVRVKITFPIAVAMNGFAIYAHNLTKDQGVAIYYSPDDSGTTLHFEDGVEFEAGGDIYTHEYKPADNLYRPFGAMWTLPNSFSVKYLVIETIGWTTQSYISIMSAGQWVTSHIDVTAPFTPPSFATYENTIKRNNRGNPLLNDVRKVPQKLNIKLNNFSEDDLEDTTDTAFTTRINGELKAWPMIEYLGYYLSRYPFFVMYTQGVSGETDAQIKADRNRLYYCTIDKSLKQPSYSSPTLLKWNINAIGYIE
tara:strand:+ start:8146 stop:9072 length:927 start_codon:yes stop_codon:yes gene_type:complete